MGEAKEGRGLGRAFGMGRNASSDEDAPEQSGAVGIVIADSVSDGDDAAQPIPAMNGAKSSESNSESNGKAGVRVAVGAR